MINILRFLSLSVYAAFFLLNPTSVFCMEEKELALRLCKLSLTSMISEPTFEDSQNSIHSKFRFSNHEEAYRALKSDGHLFMRIKNLSEKGTLEGDEFEEFQGYFEALKFPVCISIDRGECMGIDRADLSEKQFPYLTYKFFESEEYMALMEQHALEAPLIPSSIGALKPFNRSVKQQEERKRHTDDEALKVLDEEMTQDTSWGFQDYVNVTNNIIKLKILIHNALAKEGFISSRELASEGEALYLPQQRFWTSNSHLLFAYRSSKAILLRLNEIESSLRKFNKNGIHIRSSSWEILEKSKKYGMMIFSNLFTRCCNEGIHKKESELFYDLPTLERILRYAQTQRTDGNEDSQRLHEEIKEDALCGLICCYFNAYLHLPDHHSGNRDILKKKIVEWNKIFAIYNSDLSKRWAHELRAASGQKSRAFMNEHGRNVAAISALQIALPVEAAPFDNAGINVLKAVSNASKASYRVPEFTRLAYDAIQQFEDALRILSPQSATGPSEAPFKEDYQGIYKRFARESFMGASSLRFFSQISCFFIGVQDFVSLAARVESMCEALLESERPYFYSMQALVKAYEGDSSVMEKLFEAFRATKMSTENDKKTALRRVAQKVRERMRRETADSSLPLASSIKPLPVPSSKVTAAPVVVAQSFSDFTMLANTEAIQHEEKRLRHEARKKEREKKARALEAGPAEDIKETEHIEASTMLWAIRPSKNLPSRHFEDVGIRLRTKSKNIDAAITTGVWKFTQEELYHYYAELGCEIHNNGSHHIAQLPTFVTLPNGNFLAGFLDIGDEIGGSSTFVWREKEVPYYLRPQITDYRLRLWNFYHAQFQAKQQLALDKVDIIEDDD